MRKYVMAFSLLLGMFSAFHVSAAGDEPKTAEFSFALELSRCVDVRESSIDVRCLKATFFPLLGLNEGDRILEGRFYNNSDGKGFALTIEKTSRSKETTALFDLYVDLERRAYARDDEKVLAHILFEIWDGHIYGFISRSSKVVVGIYELGRGCYLVSNEKGKTVGDCDGSVSEDKLPKPTQTFPLGYLLDSGKTVGYILEERMRERERLGVGGRPYQLESESRHRPIHPTSSTVIVPKVSF